MKSLLIVDDEAFVADGLRKVLADSFRGELAVESRYSAKDALELAKLSPVDILVTDINMPDCTGLELHEKMLALSPDCAVIYLTGYSEFEYARHALDQRAFAYILKGEGDETVIKTIRRVLDKAAAAEGEKPEEMQESPRDWLSDLHAYIRAHLTEDLSLNALAEHCHFHPVYLSRAYKDAQGMTISDFIGQTKQEEAERLLRDSDKTILQISRLTGFATDNYFCRWFRKRTGSTPQAYRSSHKKRG